VKLLLDAHLSPRHLAEPLRRRGHDVVALAEEQALEGLADSEVLAFAAAEHRILITRNSRDFAPILREWAEGHRSHAGCILIWTLRHDEFRRIVREIALLLEDRASEQAWTDLVVAI
jgi:predicted nuclease of predicted toxin-antitoxin system